AHSARRRLHRGAHRAVHRESGIRSRRAAGLRGSGNVPGRAAYLVQPARGVLPRARRRAALRRTARPDRPMPRAVLIVGAGPAWLAPAACLRRRGVQADLVDRHGVAGGAYHRIYPGVTLASPARYTALPGLKPQAAGEYISVPQYRDYLGNYAAHHGLSVRKASVTRVRRESGRFHAWFKAEPQRAYDAVVVATGMFDFPRRLDGAMHASEWHGPAA